MKIIIVVLDITLKGGIERFSVNLSNLLLDSTNHISIYSLHKTNARPLYDINENIRVVYLTDLKFNKYLYKFTTLIGCANLILKHFYDFSSYKFISTYQIITIYLFLLCKKLIPYVIASEHSSFDSAARFNNILRSYVYKRVCAVVTQTQDGVDKFRLQSINAIKIPNSVTIFNDPNQWFVNSNINVDFTVITVARLDPVKQLDHFIHIAKLVSRLTSNIKFKIIGSGSELKYLTNLVLNYDISNIVEFIPANNNINHYYSIASLYLCTSKSEAFPMTILEALSYGVPVIAYNNLIGPLEIIKNEYNGWLVPINHEYVADLIYNIYLNKHNVNNFKENCIKSALEYSPQSIKVLFENIL
jgi:glycosyltransferase involved in cell wall biosynthesis